MCSPDSTATATVLCWPPFPCPLPFRPEIVSVFDLFFILFFSLLIFCIAQVVAKVVVVIAAVTVLLLYCYCYDCYSINQAATALPLLSSACDA